MRNLGWGPWAGILFGAGLAYAAYHKREKARASSLQGKVALITGGSRGLGLLLAREFGREGCRVAICARKSEELDEAVKFLRRSNPGLEIQSYSCDVSEKRQIEHVIEQITDTMGPVDILVNNAGIIQVAPVESLEIKDFERSLSVMLWGMLYPTLAVLPEMQRRQAGRIVNITSIGGMISLPHLIPYSTAKFAAVGLSQGLHAELKKDGITVTTIAPGTMRTGSHENAEFGGSMQQEYAWFSLGATLPLISIDADRAAREIVKATKYGEALRILGLPARIAAKISGVAPGLTAEMLGLVNRLLPASLSTTDRSLGSYLHQHVEQGILEKMRRYGQDAVRQYQQHKPSPS